MLRRKGFSILETGDGATGVDLFRSHVSEIDIVVLDLTLPGCRARMYCGIAEVAADVRIIVSTAYGREKATAELNEPESLYYLRKPYRIQELADLLRNVCLDKLAVLRTSANDRGVEAFGIAPADLGRVGQVPPVEQ